MPDNDGYPTDSELEILEKWDFLKDGIEPFFRYAHSIWHWDDRVRFYRGKNRLGRAVNKVYFSTGGWSGNESIIQAMEKNCIFMVTWQKILRGGHYWFEIPKRG